MAGRHTFTSAPPHTFGGIDGNSEECVAEETTSYQDSVQGRPLTPVRSSKQCGPAVAVSEERGMDSGHADPSPTNPDESPHTRSALPDAAAVIPSKGEPPGGSGVPEDEVVGPGDSGKSTEPTGEQPYKPPPPAPRPTKGSKGPGGECTTGESSDPDQPSQLPISKPSCKRGGRGRSLSQKGGTSSGPGGAMDDGELSAMDGVTRSGGGGARRNQPPRERPGKTGQNPKSSRRGDDAGPNKALQPTRDEGGSGSAKKPSRGSRREKKQGESIPQLSPSRRIIPAPDDDNSDDSPSPQRRTPPRGTGDGRPGSEKPVGRSPPAVGGGGRTMAVPPQRTDRQPEVRALGKGPGPRRAPGDQQEEGKMKFFYLYQDEGSSRWRLKKMHDNQLSYGTEGSHTSWQKIVAVKPGKVTQGMVNVLDADLPYAGRASGGHYKVFKRRVDDAYDSHCWPGEIYPGLSIPRLPPGVILVTVTKMRGEDGAWGFVSTQDGQPLCMSTTSKWQKHQGPWL